VILYFMQPTFLYSPVQEVPYTPGELGLDFESVVFESADGLQLSGWYIPAPLEVRTEAASVQPGNSPLTGPAGKPEQDAKVPDVVLKTGMLSTRNSEFTVLFCHGNGGNMCHRLDSINIFYNLGLNCFIFDYRGYGNSQGKTSEEGTYLDVGAAYKWLTEEKGISPEKIIVFGRSLGGSIAAELARKVEVRALVVESAFTSYVDIGKKFYPYMPVRWFARFDYKTIDYIKGVRCPVMIIHSRNDEIIPFEFGLELYEAANEPKEFIEIFGSHNDGFLVAGEIYKKAWIRWLKSLKEYEGETARQQAS